MQDIIEEGASQDKAREDYKREQQLARVEFDRLAKAYTQSSDRLVHVYVIDFLDFYAGGWHWPAFNVADSAVCVGAILLALTLFRTKS